MRLHALRPAGDALFRSAGNSPSLDGRLGKYDTYYTESGTAALALALGLLKTTSSRDKSKVLLPAYGCPDLVSAVKYVGLEPRLVDLCIQEPFMSLKQLRTCLDDQVLAIVGVHFLGLAERIERIMELACQYCVSVIEDSAQRIPGAGGLGAAADFVVLSFGRGKPAGALGGGALLVRAGLFSVKEVEALIHPASRLRIPCELKRLAYNRLIKPFAYSMVCRMPGIGLGQAKYRSLRQIRGLDEPRRHYASAQLLRVRQAEPSIAQRSIAALVREFVGLRDLSSSGLTPPNAALVRFPLLCSSKFERDALFASLTKRRLGASIMYGSSLRHLPGVPYCEASSIDAASDFADRLLTLPIHSDVSGRDVDEIARALALQLPRK